MTPRRVAVPTVPLHKLGGGGQEAQAQPSSAQPTGSSLASVPPHPGILCPCGLNCSLVLAVPMENPELDHGKAWCDTGTA